MELRENGATGLPTNQTLTWIQACMHAYPPPPPPNFSEPTSSNVLEIVGSRKINCCGHVKDKHRPLYTLGETGIATLRCAQEVHDR